MNHEMYIGLIFALVKCIAMWVALQSCMVVVNVFSLSIFFFLWEGGGVPLLKSNKKRRNITGWFSSKQYTGTMPKHSCHDMAFLASETKPCKS
jgi:hypothetical protein